MYSFRKTAAYWDNIFFLLCFPLISPYTENEIFAFFFNTMIFTLFCNVKIWPFPHFKNEFHSTLLSKTTQRSNFKELGSVQCLIYVFVIHKTFQMTFSNMFGIKDICRFHNLTLSAYFLLTLVNSILHILNSQRLNENNIFIFHNHIDITSNYISLNKKRRSDIYLGKIVL